jgi:triacylglycerol esterase/lipase EstA (alpha/beta hydrolase family)
MAERRNAFRREEVEGGDVNPVIFVAHSTGGLIIKQAYLLGMHNRDYKHIVDSISSIIFLSTPHRGSNSSNLSEVLRRILTASGRVPKSLIAGVHNSLEALQDLNEQFRQSASWLSICSFYETLPTSIGFRKAIVLQKDSSVLGYPNEISKALDADHEGICKYSSRFDPNYISVRNAIQRFIAQSRSKAEQQAQSSSVGFAAQSGSGPTIYRAPSVTLSGSNLEEQLHVAAFKGDDLVTFDP